MDFSDEQLQFCARVRQAPREIALSSLVDLLVPSESSEGVLLRLSQLERVLELLALQVAPGIADGALDAVLLVSAKAAEPSLPNVMREIEHGEDQHTEFKSTFTCCFETLKRMPDLAASHLKKPSIEDSCLSAIAGLMNAGGGVLLIGVGDEGEVIGLEPDFHAMGVGNADKWLNYVRSKIERWFLDGRAISPLIDFSFIDVGGKTVARAVVHPRPKLAFLFDPEKEKCPPRLLFRVGNRTTDIKAADLEEFFELRARTRAGR